MYAVFTRMPCDNVLKATRSLVLHFCDVFRALTDSLVCIFIIVYGYTSSYFLLTNNSFVLHTQHGLILFVLLLLMLLF